jgi:hypothetical protein
MAQVVECLPSKQKALRWKTEKQKQNPTTLMRSAIKVQGEPGQIVHTTPTPKITTAKWTGGVAQKTPEYSVLSLTTNPTKKKNPVIFFLLSCVVKNFNL